MMKLSIAAGGCAVGLAAFLGFFLLVKGSRNVQRAVASPDWPRTAGLVAGSDANRTTVQYRVDGQDYATNVIHFGQILGSGDASETALQKIRYPAGSKVSVSYDPRAPWLAAIRPGLHAEAFWLPGAALAFLLPAAIFLMLSPAIVRSIRKGMEAEHAFESAVQRAMEDAGRGVAPPNTLPFPAPGGTSDGVAAVVAAIFAGVFCALGVLALASGMQKMWRGYASQAWPTASAEIVSANMRSGDGGYAPDLLYQYTVAGTKHLNNVRHFGTVQAQSEERANELLSRYAAGKKVPVAYFPTDPDVAVLEPGINRDALWLPGVGLVALLFSLSVLIWFVPSIARST